jgi:hypothetical protein
MPHTGQAGAASDPAGSASQGPGLLLEPDGTFVTLVPSATNVLTVPAGSLIINSDGTLMSPSAGTYATGYGLLTVAQAPSSGTPSAGTGTPGPPAPGTTTSVNPGGPLQTQTPPQQQPAQGQTTTGSSQPAGGTAPEPPHRRQGRLRRAGTGTAAPTSVATAAKAPAAKAPAGAAPAAKPPVQVVSALGGVTVADNGTVAPNGSLNLAFPGSGIGGSLPLSLPSATPAQPTQLAFPPTDQNAVLTDPIFQGLIQSLGQQGAPPVPLPAPIPNLVPNTGTAIASQAAPDATPGNLVQLASLNGLPQPDSVPMAQGGQPAADGALANLSPSGALLTSPAQSQDSVTLPPLPSAPAAGYIRVWDPTSNTYADYPVAGTGNVPVTPNSIYIDDNGGVYLPQGVQPGNAVGVPAAQGTNFYVPLDYVAPVQPLPTIMPDSSTGLPSLNGSVPVIPQGTIDQATRSLLYQEQPAPPPGPPAPANPPVPTNFLNPAADNAMPASGQAPNTANQFAANGFDANGNPVMSDASPLPAQLAQNQAPVPSLTQDSLTVILPDGTPQTFPLGASAGRHRAVRGGPRA